MRSSVLEADSEDLSRTSPSGDAEEAARYTGLRQTRGSWASGSLRLAWVENRDLRVVRGIDVNKISPQRSAEVFHAINYLLRIYYVRGLVKC